MKRALGFLLSTEQPLGDHFDSGKGERLPSVILLVFKLIFVELSYALDSSFRNMFSTLIVLYPAYPACFLARISTNSRCRTKAT